jgi:2-keto-3-deoxy-L-rhamnonate aldolase RhmA
MDLSGGKYASTANQDSLLLAQIESVEGLANVEQIAAVPGIDGLMFGPSDYSLDCGVDAGSALNLSEPAIWEAAKRIAQSCAKHGKVACNIVNSCETAVRLAKVGYQMLGVSMDAVLLHSALSDNLANFQQALKDR